MSALTDRTVQMAEESRAMVAGSRMFTFSSGTTKPRARVRCHGCGWTAKGNDPRKVFPKADEHVCPAKTPKHSDWRCNECGALESDGGCGHDFELNYDEALVPVTTPERGGDR